MKRLVVECLWTHLSKDKEKKGRQEGEKERRKRRKETGLHSKLQLWNTFFPIIAFSCAQSNPFSLPLTSWTLSILNLLENASLPPPPEQASAGMVTACRVCVCVCECFWDTSSALCAKCNSSSVLMLLGRRVRENSEYSQTYLTPLSLHSVNSRLFSDQLWPGVRTMAPVRSCWLSWTQGWVPWKLLQILQLHSSLEEIWL